MVCERSPPPASLLHQYSISAMRCNGFRYQVNAEGQLNVDKEQLPWWVPHSSWLPLMGINGDFDQVQYHCRNPKENLPGDSKCLNEDWCVPINRCRHVRELPVPTEQRQPPTRSLQGNMRLAAWGNGIAKPQQEINFSAWFYTNQTCTQAHTPLS